MLFVFVLYILRYVTPLSLISMINYIIKIFFTAQAFTLSVERSVYSRSYACITNLGVLAMSIMTG